MDIQSSLKIIAKVDFLLKYVTILAICVLYHLLTTCCTSCSSVVGLIRRVTMLKDGVVSTCKLCSYVIFDLRISLYMQISLICNIIFLFLKRLYYFNSQRYPFLLCKDEISSVVQEEIVKVSHCGMDERS